MARVSAFQAEGCGFETRLPLQLFLLAAILSFAVKIFLATLFHNYDLESYELVQDLFRHGPGVYAGTNRYNYGPLWFLTLGALGWLNDHLNFGGRESFHVWVAIFLASVDVAVAWTVRRMGYGRAALLFLLNPISIVISGFHSQFDQLPVLIALPAVWALIREEGAVSPGKALGVAAILGLSFIAKHSLLFLPLWLGFWLITREPKNWPAAAVIIFLPPALFLLSFAPWLGNEAARQGISTNVFHYASDNLYALVPKIFGVVGLNRLLDSLFGWVPIFSGYKFFWLAATVALGWLFRRRGPLDLLLLNTVTLIVLTPALSDQYLVIPALACAFYWRSPWIKAYVLLTSIFLCFFSPVEIITVPALSGLRAALEPIPVRRYFAVAFLAIFLAQQVRCVTGKPLSAPAD